MRIILKILPYHIFFLLFISTKSEAEKRNYNFSDFNGVTFRVQDSSQLSNKQPEKYSGLGWAGLIRLGLGHHDNLTQTKSWTGPKLKPSNTYWTARLEGGPGYKSVYLHFFISATPPIPRITTVGGYNHRVDFDDKGVLLRLRLLPVPSKVNVIPILGYKWLNESARIYDPRGIMTDSLNVKNHDPGPFYGAELQYIFLRLPHEQDLRLVFTYLYENLRNDDLNRYRIAFGPFEYGLQKNLKGKNVLSYVGFLTLSIEHVSWSRGRNDWFVALSLGGTVVY